MFIGIDPDSKKHGFCIINHLGKIDLIGCLSTIELYHYFLNLKEEQKIFKVSLEDNKKYNLNPTRAAQRAKTANNNNMLIGKLGISVGMVIQAQNEIQYILDFLCIDYHLAKPSKKFKDKHERQNFIQIFNYKKATNADSRSACFFAYQLYLNSKLEQRKVK